MKRNIILSLWLSEGIGKLCKMKTMIMTMALESFAMFSKIPNDGSFYIYLVCLEAVKKHECLSLLHFLARMKLHYSRNSIQATEQ